jgi:hypothetical protein
MQAGRSPVSVPDKADWFNLPNPSSRIMAPGPTQPLTKMSTRNLPVGKKRPTRKANNLSPIYEPKGLHGLYMDKFTFYCYLIHYA